MIFTTIKNHYPKRKINFIDVFEQQMTYLDTRSGISGLPSGCHICCLQTALVFDMCNL
jgi:hypothetical protein